MALPPLADNNTARLFIHYNTGGGLDAQDHVMSIRYNAPSVSPFDVMSDLADHWTSSGMDGALFDGWRVLSAESQAQGAIIRLPVVVPPALLAFVGAGQLSATPSEQAREVRYIGRGAVTGRRVSLSLFGVATTAITDLDFRFTPVAPAPLALFRDFIQSQAVPGAAYINIGAGSTNWYTYVNWQFNSHWETAQRS